MTGTLRTGSVISGKYEVHKVLGEGGMSLAYAGVHLDVCRPVAIKELQPGFLGCKELVGLSEMQEPIAAQLPVAPSATTVTHRPAAAPAWLSPQASFAPPSTDLAPAHEPDFDPRANADARAAVKQRAPASLPNKSAPIGMLLVSLCLVALAVITVLGAPKVIG